MGACQELVAIGTFISVGWHVGIQPLVTLVQE
jgi:hypothetical protein